MYYFLYHFTSHLMYGLHLFCLVFGLFGIKGPKRAISAWFFIQQDLNLVLLLSCSAAC